MKYFESVNIRLITQSTDDITLVREKLHALLDLDWEKEKLAFEESSFTDSFDEQRHVFTLQLTKQRHVNVFAKMLAKRLNTETKQTILTELPKQVDESSHFFVRFDLDAFFADEFKFTLDGRCIHFNLAVCAHPRRQSVAIEVVEGFLRQEQTI